MRAAWYDRTGAAATRSRPASRRRPASKPASFLEEGTVPGKVLVTLC